MLAQIRTYTINKGQLDAFIKQFQEEVMPMHERIGLPVVAQWVNRPQNEFIWVRQFEDAADRDAKLKAFSEERERIGIVLGTQVAKMEIVEAEVASVPAMST